MSKPRKAIRPRDYQLEAVKWALDRDGAVVVMPTGSGKTLIAAPWIKELISREVVKRVLVLEPTRIHVKQTAKYICEVVGAKAVPIHGKTPKSKRVSLWKKSLVAVATPKTALSVITSLLEKVLTESLLMNAAIQLVRMHIQSL